MKKYLIIADMEGDKQSAIYRGIELAKRSKASVHIVAFVYDAYIDELIEELPDDMQQQVLGARRQQLDAVLADIDCSGVDIDAIEVVWAKDFSPWVIEVSKTGDYSMIIKTGHRTENVIHTPSEWRILRESAVPNMLVASKKWKQKNHILCAIDLSGKKSQEALNRNIIEQGKALAEMFDGELNCCYAVPIPTVLVDLDVVDRRKIEEKGKQKAQKNFAVLAEEFGLDESALHMKAGKAEKVIPSIADKLKARMVVVGTVGRSGVKGKLLGNTAEQVVHHLRTDLLAVKP